MRLDVGEIILKHRWCVPEFLFFLFFFNQKPEKVFLKNTHVCVDNAFSLSALTLSPLIVFTRQLAALVFRAVSSLSSAVKPPLLSPVLPPPLNSPAQGGSLSLSVQLSGGGIES